MMTKAGGILLLIGIVLMAVSMFILELRARDEDPTIPYWPFFSTKRNRRMWWLGIACFLIGIILVLPAYLAL